MVQSSFGDSGKTLNKEWHKGRLEARLSLGEFEFDEIDIERFDLDEIDFDRTMLPVRTKVQIEAEKGPKSGEPLQGQDEDPVRD